ncbi:MAG: TonB-dependent receptor [Flavobacteriales bacterium]|nr:TonB-dependent receptor [Flavobacteriales bacterium]
MNSEELAVNINSSIHLRLFAIFILATQCSICRAELTDEDLLDLSLEELLNVVVYVAAKGGQALKDVPGTVMVITANDIKIRGYDYLEDALRDLPGIDFVDIQGTFPVLWAPRGAYGDENKRTLLLIDGIVENNILEGNVLGGPQYSLHNVKRIEFLWGPASALYGANAFSGVINVITKKGRDISGSEIHLGIGENNTHLQKFLIGHQLDNVEYSFSGSLYNSDGPGFEERHPDYSLSYVDDAFSLSGKISFADITIGAHHFDRPMGHGQFSNAPSAWFGLPLYGYQNSEGQATPGSIAPTEINGEPGSLWRSITSTVYLKYHHEFNENIQMDEKIYYRETGIHSDSYVYGLFDNQWGFLPFTHDSYLLGGEWQMSVDFDEDQNFVFGLGSEHSSVEKGYRQWYVIQDSPKIWGIVNERVSVRYKNNTIFGQYKQATEFLNSTTFTLGVRYDDNNVYGSTTNPRIGIVTKPNEQLTLKAMYGTAFRAPNGFDSFTETTTRIANPDLEPEKTENWELSAGIQINPSWLSETSVFRNRLSDVIVSNVAIEDTDGDGVPNSQNQNVGSASTQGIEWCNHIKLSRAFSAFAHISYQDTEQQLLDSEIDIPNVAHWKGNSGVTWRQGDNWSLYWSLRAVGPRSTAPTNPRKEVAGYVTSDVTIHYRPLGNQRLELNLRIINLFDTKYSDPGIRAANGVSFSTEQTYPGRIVNIKMSTVF